MTDWKLLGEVPDSEDEDAFDSQDVPAGPDPTSEPTSKAPEAKSRDIWDFPDSGDEVEEPAKKCIPVPSPNYSQSSSPLSSVQSLDGFEELLLEPLVCLPHAESPVLSPHAESPVRSPLAEPPARSPLAEPSSPGSGALPNEDLNPIENDIDLQREAVRLERSLRPRKPIQQHPYLLENAQYSSLIRKHGMRPVQIEAARAKTDKDERSQDVEFQDNSQPNSLPEPANSSQAHNQNGLDDNGDVEVLDLLSSSPIKTSPWAIHIRSSNRSSSLDDTDITSVPDQDFPTLQELLSPHKTSPALKRPHIAPKFSARKRRRRDVIVNNAVAMEIDLSGDQVQPSSSGTVITSGPLPPIPRLQLTAKPLMAVSPTKSNAASVYESDNEEESLRQNRRERQDDASDDGSKEFPEFFSRIGKRIKGVLPASWLRLDQQANRGKAQSDMNRLQRNRTPEREVRRGVAQPKVTSTSTSSNIQSFFFDDSEDEAEVRPANMGHAPSRLVSAPNEKQVITVDDFSNDSSVVEHDTIDFMTSGPTRKRKIGDKPRTKSTNVNSRNRSTPKLTQQKMTSFNRALSASSITSKQRPSDNARPQAITGSHRRRRAKRKTKPKPLSVLDVIEPDAPSFLRIAARTVRSRANQGRSSPTKKVIRLASRTDYIDAMSLLDKWRADAIPQRPEVSAALRNRHKKGVRKPLSESNVNKVAAPRRSQRPPAATSTKRRKFVKQRSNGGSACYLPAQDNAHNATKDRMPSMNSDENATHIDHSENLENPVRARLYTSNTLRPALLEAEEQGKVAPVAFQKRKNFLDRIYRGQKHKNSADSTDTRSELSLDRIFSTSLPIVGSDTAVEKQPKLGQVQYQKRKRKKSKPSRVDIDAPQFSHAADPLPIPYIVDAEAEQQLSVNANVKLGGLGPYGTEYTTHFEIFPLDHGVYFHESTLLGSDIINKCQTSATKETLLSSRSRTFFQFGDYSFRWHEWNDQTYSELGILMDFIADELENPDSTTATGQTIVQASQFISKFSTAALCFNKESEMKSFIARVLDVTRNLHSRISNLVSKNTLRDVIRQTSIRVYDHLIVLAFMSLLICNNNGLTVEKFQAEELVKSLSAGSMSVLLSYSIDKLKEEYARLQINGVREKGIRASQQFIHSWALVMHILEASHIPRGSFWHILKQQIATDDKVAIHDARIYERIWETVFAMLPICEFSPCGILVPGKRFDSTSDGWMIVQQLLRQVFSVYRENSHQAPSFNNYCRALISRCHFLVQQWGWRRSVSIVGSIFDFFGSQNLEHLRNEEVHASPKFLEQLAGEPCLAVEPDDKCFHIFLKFLALSIQKLRTAGAVNDIRNLVARTIPNHNRQHLKELTVHERDLAALRNHHDLLATLFWSAPANLRPSVTLFERLVVPEASHKEANLINIRCWNQLARFIAAKGRASTDFKSFRLWRNGFFQKIVQQFDSAAADIQQQLMALPKEVRHTVDDETIASMINANKGAASDVLHVCITASLDVMKWAEGLETATFCLNTLQLQHVYRQFVINPPELGWTTLGAALSTLDIFLDRIGEFKENEESQQSESRILDSAQADDALLLLDHEISKNLFSMVRHMLSNRFKNQSPSDKSPEKCYGKDCVMVAIRLAVSFIDGGLISLHDVFRTGKYGLFDGPIHKQDLEKREYLVLAVIKLLKAGVDNFSDVGFTLCELWLLFLVMPKGHHEHENQLADILRQRGEFFVPATDSGLTLAPNYEANCTLFEFAISAMRRSVRDAGPTLKRVVIAEYSTALKLVMEQMKEDLKSMSSQPILHVPYVAFVRQIVSLIRAHGSEICTLDNFYYQISKDYSPSTDDPQLQVAAMVSYGLRLGEGDHRVVQQVFFFLFNNFKLAVIANSLASEEKMLQKGMAGDGGIARFILGKMLPAIIGAVALKPVAYPLLDLYVWAIQHQLTLHTTTPCLVHLDTHGVKVVFQAIFDGIKNWAAGNPPLTAVRLHILCSYFYVVNLFWPSIYEHSLNEPHSSEEWSDVVALIGGLEAYAAKGKAMLGSAELGSFTMRFNEIFPTTLSHGTANRCVEDPDVVGFIHNIQQDVERSWVQVNGIISIETPGKPRGGGASVQGVREAEWDATALLQGVTAEVVEFMRWKKKMDGDGGLDGKEFDVMIF